MTVVLQPVEPRHVVHVGTAIRKPAGIVAAYLDSLDQQVRPPGVEFFYHFILDTADPDVRDLVAEFVRERPGRVELSSLTDAADYGDGAQTRQWSSTAFKRVAQHKENILTTARNAKAAGVWYVDADLLCGRRTFWSLWSVAAPITCGVYWTRWTPSSHPLPQVWLTHPYGLAGKGMNEAEFLRRLQRRQVVSVAGQGACTLIRAEALTQPISWLDWHDVPPGPMSDGEDRHFCRRAEALHLAMVADAWPDIFHVYRDEDVSQMAAWRQILAVESPLPPQLGDQVSVLLRPAEPIPTEKGAQALGAKPWRGRLGCGLMPELERAIGDMRSGDRRLVAVHFPLDYPTPGLRGQRRIIEVTLVDHRPNRLPPGVASVTDWLAEDQRFYVPAQREAMA